MHKESLTFQLILADQYKPNYILSLCTDLSAQLYSAGAMGRVQGYIFLHDFLLSSCGARRKFVISFLNIGKKNV